MKIIACLGNPGNSYRKNRHNFGFIAGEFIAGQFGIRAGQKKFSSLLGTGAINGIDVVMLFPQTYMNNSGQAIQAALNFYKAAPSDLIALHDEIEIKFGQINSRFGGSPRGHNGLRSIIQHVGTGDFFRIRLGVGRPESPHIDVADYVLSNFTAAEEAALTASLPLAVDALLAILAKPEPGHA